MLSGIDRYKRLRSEAGWLYIREILHRSESNFEDICQFTGWQSTLHLNFGDFAKEFDSVNRKELWRLLQYYDVPIEVVNVINKMYMLITGTKRVTCVLLDSNPPPPSPTNWTPKSSRICECYFQIYLRIQSQLKFVLLYQFYTFGAEIRESKTGILSFSRASRMESCCQWKAGSTTWVT